MPTKAFDIQARVKYLFSVHVQLYPTEKIIVKMIIFYLLMCSPFSLNVFPVALMLLKLPLY